MQMAIQMLMEMDLSSHFKFLLSNLKKALYKSKKISNLLKISKLC